MSKIGLFICGGNINSAFTAGYVAAIEKLGKQDEIKYLVGSSAGSFTAAFILAEMCQEATKGYWSIPLKTHFNPLYNIKKYKTLSFYKSLIQDMFLYDNPIKNWDKIVEHKLNKSGKYLIQLYDVQTDKIVFATKFKTGRAVLECITASCWIPIISGNKPYTFPPEVYNELELIDEKGTCIKQKTGAYIDPATVDMFLESATKYYNGKKVIVINQVPEGEVSGIFGRHLRYLEYLISRLLYIKYPDTVKRSAQYILFGGANTQKKELFENKTDDTTIIYPGYSIRGLGPKDFRARAELGFQRGINYYKTKVAYPHIWNI